MEDLDKGEIYLLVNKTNGKKYVGQAQKYVTVNNIKWGTEGRWGSHIREAINGSKDHCILLNQAIRKYGKENFEVIKLCDCLLIEMNALEQEYIDKERSRVPYGYNLRDGCSNGKASPESIAKMIKSRTGMKYSDKAKANISKGQLGNRRGVKVRKHEEDKDLPKYIFARRKDGKIYAYGISGFPIGIESKKYLRKNFTVRQDETKDDTLRRANAYLDELKEKYKDIQAQVQEVKDKQEEKDIDEKMASKKSAKLPDNIRAIVSKKKLVGYYTEGLKGHDGTVIPRKDFTEHAIKHNLRQAMQYVQQIGNLNHHRAKIDDWSKVDVATKSNKRGTGDRYLPKYVVVIKEGDNILGYSVKGFPYTDENGTKKKHNKDFADPGLSLDDKYKLAIAHLEEMNVKFNVSK